MKKKVAITKKISVKHKTEIIDIPAETIKAALADMGFAGNLLVKATNQVFNEAKSLTRQGVVNATDFEKAVVKAIKKTNDIAIGATRKITKKILK